MAHGINRDSGEEVKPDGRAPPPHDLRREEIRYLLEAEEHAANGRTERDGHASRTRRTQNLAAFRWSGVSISVNDWHHERRRVRVRTFICLVLAEVPARRSVTASLAPRGCVTYRLTILPTHDAMCTKGPSLPAHSLMKLEGPLGRRALRTERQPRGDGERKPDRFGKECAPPEVAVDNETCTR